MLSVTKNSFHIYFQYSAQAMTQAQIRDSCAARMADIHSAVFVFDEDLACELEIKDFLDTEGILPPQRTIGLAYVELLLRAANVRAASNDTCAESNPLHQLVSYPDWKRQSSFAWMAVFK